MGGEFRDDARGFRRVLHRAGLAVAAAAAGGPSAGDRRPGYLLAIGVGGWLVVWGFGGIAHWVIANAARLQGLYMHAADLLEQRGLYGAPLMRILTSTEVHGTVERAARYLGLVVANIMRLPVDDFGRLRPESLDAAFAESPEAPAIVILQAADLNIGAYDSFAELIPIARRHGAWIHVDGAFGLWAAASERWPERHQRTLRWFRPEEAARRSLHEGLTKVRKVVYT